MLKCFAILLFTLSFFKCCCQSITKELANSNSFYYKQNTYVYGYKANAKNTVFKCYKFNQKLVLKDSIEMPLPNYKAEQLLQINTDTLHNYINFYFQLANQKNTVTLLRLNDTLGKVCFIQNYDANHINSLAAFDDEQYIYNEDMYLVRTSVDSGNTQFYISKYKIKDITKPFEYDFKWQFAFERKYIHTATVIYADSNYVIAFVNVKDGLKKGQWILRLNASDGKLIRGTKLNLKTNSNLYLMSNYYYNPKQKTIDVLGSVYKAELLNYETESTNFKSIEKQHQIFIITIDSLGDIESRTEKTLLIPIQSNKLNANTTYHLKLRKVQKTKDGNFAICSDIYENSTPNLFKYVSSWQFNLELNDIDYDIKSTPFYNATSVLPNFISTDKGNYYGKIETKLPTHYVKFKYQVQKNNVVIKTGIDDLNNPFYVLKKTEILKKTSEFMYVFVGKKGLETKVILKTEPGQTSHIYFLDNMHYISFINNISNSNFELKLNSLW